MGVVAGTSGSMDRFDCWSLFDSRGCAGDPLQRRPAHTLEAAGQMGSVSNSSMSRVGHVAALLALLTYVGGCRRSARHEGGGLRVETARQDLYDDSRPKRMATRYPPCRFED